MKKIKNAFTMVELIFVIVILGILSAVAIPKLAAGREDAEVTKGLADIASIRSGIISERQTRLIQGLNGFIPTGTATYLANGNTYKQIDNGGLFGGVLMYPIANAGTGKAGKWASAVSGTYFYQVGGTQFRFDYNQTTGTFNCTSSTNALDMPCSIWD